MRRAFSLLSIALYTGAVFLAGMLVVQLYALYVLVYTGAVFMLGVYLGERMERRLASRSADDGDPPVASGEITEFRESDELTLRKG